MHILQANLETITFSCEISSTYEDVSPIALIDVIRISHLPITLLLGSSRKFATRLYSLISNDSRYGCRENNLDITYPSAGRVQFLGSVQKRLRSQQNLLDRHYGSVTVRREGLVTRLYHQEFHLELPRASFRSRTKLQGLYLTLFGEGVGLGHGGGDNSMILA
jgi:hypothetical protein